MTHPWMVLDDSSARYVDDLDEVLVDAVNATGEVYLSHTNLHDRYVVRLAVGNLRTTRAHVERAWQLLQEHAARLDRIRRPRDDGDE